MHLKTQVCVCVCLKQEPKVIIMSHCRLLNSYVVAFEFLKI